MTSAEGRGTKGLQVLLSALPAGSKAPATRPWALEPAPTRLPAPSQAPIRLLVPNPAPASAACARVSTSAGDAPMALMQTRPLWWTARQAAAQNSVDISSAGGSGAPRRKSMSTDSMEVSCGTSPFTIKDRASASMTWSRSWLPCVSVPAPKKRRANRVAAASRSTTVASRLGSAVSRAMGSAIPPPPRTQMRGKADGLLSPDNAIASAKAEA
mmetsp:Transcript_7833/g.16273  ORF Transcript_7833/g.16273 Transcript_7833/m.16273 type:complete len:213 (+) Transcript_7833:97-735(+)